MGAPHWSTHVDPRLTAWTTQRRAELRQPTDPRAYLAWNPFQFLPRIHNVTRDVRLQLNDAQLLIAEVYVDDAIRRAAGEDRMLVALVSSPRIFYRAAIRSKGSSGLADGMNQGLKALDQMFGGSVAPTLGDPHFERWFDLKFPTPAEGNAALVMPLRHLLVQAGFRGIFELRQGGFILHRMDAMRFDPIDLDKVLDAVSRIYAVIAP